MSIFKMTKKDSGNLQDEKQTGDSSTERFRIASLEVDNLTTRSTRNPTQLPDYNVNNHPAAVPSVVEAKDLSSSMSTEASSYLRLPNALVTASTIDDENLNRSEEMPCKTLETPGSSEEWKHEAARKRQQWHDYHTSLKATSGSRPLLPVDAVQYTTSIDSYSSSLQKRSFPSTKVVSAGKRPSQLHDLPPYSPQADESAIPEGERHKPDTTICSNKESRYPHGLTIETRRVSDAFSPPVRPVAGRASSTPANVKNPDLSSTNQERPSKPRAVSKSDGQKAKASHQTRTPLPSPRIGSVPLPPLSLPGYLQLELSSHRPSQLYIQRPSNADFPYESSRVKIERLTNFLFLPHQLEAILWFGTLACLDSWLYTFTILPLRLLKSIYILGQSWSRNMISEARFISTFIYSGLQRMWRRRRTRGGSIVNGVASRKNSEVLSPDEKILRARNRKLRHHERSKSTPSALLPDDKADILKGLLIICTCLVLLRLDASRMYHWVRGQAAIKLYVIYNVLEVCDRLLSAIGQDVLECLFSQEALERKPDGHSKILRPFWLFILALGYTIVHSTALFYQVVTLNVAVNSYSNALITLLMSNQFVEIKSTVFKKFEKENLFQLTCADVVERFQLWHMLMIIAARNIVETGGFDFGINALVSPSTGALASNMSNSSATGTQVIPPTTASSILPRSFTLVPSIVSSISAYVPTISHVLGPFIIVLGSEMLIDWLKHAYINKFNNARPAIYGRFLDILAKDYYINAFGDQNLTKRLGLPVIPLSCLMIRASVQTYQMFMAAWLPPLSPSTTSLASIHELYSASRSSMPTSAAAVLLRKVDELLYQIPSSIVRSTTTSHFTVILIMLLVFLVLLACKLVLGMALLVFARSRYRTMRDRERNPSHYVDGGRRVGGWGVVEVDEDKRQCIYEDDPAGIRALKEREAKEQIRRDQDKDLGGNVEGLDKVKRYEMVAKRIW